MQRMAASDSKFYVHLIRLIFDKQYIIFNNYALKKDKSIKSFHFYCHFEQLNLPLSLLFLKSPNSTGPLKF